MPGTTKERTSDRLRSVDAIRYVTALREGGSLPGLVEGDDDGTWVVKFRGAGQGVRALIVEILAGGIARALDLNVPEIVLAETERARPDDERLAHLVDVAHRECFIARSLRTEVTVTPTYSGCPATSFINRAIEEALHDAGIAKVALKRQLSPPWTTDWLTEGGKRKLEAYGIAPPTSPKGPERCPHCGGADLERISAFGSTPCKAQWRCRDCLEPFDHFKCI